MWTRRPTRLPAFSYTGYARYHVRTSTRDRLPVFLVGSFAVAGRAQLLLHAPAFELSLRAYCFMPDHVHLLVEGRATDADLRRFVRNWKQATGFEYARATGRRLWQAGYFERVLRDDENTATVAAYILGNPVRAGLTRRVGEYPYAWAQGYELGDLGG